MKITVNSNFPMLYPILNGSLPDGVKVSDLNSLPSATRAGGPEIDIAVNIDVDLVIDFTRIASGAFAVWIVKLLSKVKGKHAIEINGAKFSIDTTNAEEQIKNEIDKQQSQNDN